MFHHLSLPRYFKSKPLVGLDISRDAIRILALQKKPMNMEVERIMHEKTHTAAIDEGETLDWDKIKEQLLAMVAREKLSGHFAAIALPSAMVMQKQIQLPAYLQQDELPEAVASRLMEYFPGILPKEVFFDFILEVTKNEMHQILLLVARKIHFQTYLDAVAAAGLKVKVIDVDVYARARAGLYCLSHQHTDRQEALILADVHWPQSSWMVFQDNHLLFHHLWRTQSAGAGLRQEIQKAMQLTLSSFPKLKCSFMAISGSLGGLEGLTADLQDSYDMPTVFMSPLKSLAYASHINQDIINQTSSQFLLCLGLALRNISA